MHPWHGRECVTCLGGHSFKGDMAETPPQQQLPGRKLLQVNAAPEQAGQWLIKCFWLAGSQRQSLFFLYSDKQSGEGKGEGGAGSGCATQPRRAAGGAAGGIRVCTHIARTRVSSSTGGHGHDDNNTRSHPQGCSQLRGHPPPPPPPVAVWREDPPLCAHQHGDDIPGGTGPAPGGCDGPPH